MRMRTGLCRHTDEVATLEVEAVQLVARLLRIHDVFIDDEGGALGVAGNALADLTVEASAFTSESRARILSTQPTGSVRTCRRARRAPPVLRCSYRGGQHQCRQTWGGYSTTNLRFLTNKALDMSTPVSTAPQQQSGAGQVKSS